MANNQYRCVTGTNGIAKAPEYVSLTVPTGASGGRSASNQDLKNFCSLVEGALYRTCSEYFYSDGRPTTEGKRGLDCLWGGLSLGLAGLAAGIPLPLVLGGLDLLSGSFDCQGIVRMDILTGILGQPGVIEQVTTLLGI